MGSRKANGRPYVMTRKAINSGAALRESGEAGGGLSNSFPASAAISFQPRMLKKQHSEILLPGARRREFSHAGKDSAHLITRARFVKRNPKT